MKPFVISCPHCGQALEAVDTLVGQTVQCPTCGKPFTMPDNRMRQSKTLQPKGKNRQFGAKIVLALAVLGALLFAVYKLRTGFQHPEDAEHPAVLGGERALLVEFGAELSPGKLADFLLTFWDEKASRQARSQIVPWAALKLHEKELRDRIDLMTSFFRQARTNYAQAFANALQKDHERNLFGRKYLDERLNRASQENPEEEWQRIKKTLEERGLF